MRLNPIPAFKNPRTRPRAIIWSLVVLMGFLVMWAGSMIGTSTYWFCTTPCHKVHDDNTLAYNASTHHKVSCMACHEPVNATPLEFTLLKIHVLPDLPATILDQFELPMNEGSYVAMEMPSEQCTQCHNLKMRPITATRGIIIDHDVHEEADITCPTCHNRVAHPEEDIELVLAGDEKHENWMTMDACFRCHGTEESKAPRECSACHPKNFDLVPPSHDAKNWYTKYGDSKGHAKAAREESESVGHALELAAHFEEPEHAHGPVLEPAGTVNTCLTCHERSYCDGCHGAPIPHPSDFAKTHSKTAAKNPAACAQCHARSKAEAVGTGACNACHHPFNKPGVPLTKTHPAAARETGGKDCLRCHDERQCAACHVKIATQ